MTEHAGVAPVGPRAAADGPVGRYRWVVVGLLFAAMVINYVDRQTIGVLKPHIQGEFGWSETDYADIVFWFQASYAVFYLLWGRIIDRIGARWGFGIAFGIWEMAFIVTGVAGLIWLPIWLLVYRRPREHKKVTAAELAHIEQDPADPPGK